MSCHLAFASNRRFGIIVEWKTHKCIVPSGKSKRRAPGSVFPKVSRHPGANMDDYRKDSVYLDFSGMPVRPKLEKIHELISKKIQLDMNKVNCIQPSMTKARVIIELKSQAYVEELVAGHSLKHTVEINNKEYAIPIVPYDNAIEVRIADLPSYFSTETIARHLAQYGEVLSTQTEVWKNFWPGLPTGVRLARMRIKKPIPSYIPMATHTAFITYRNQIRTCRYCVRPLHIGRTCNEARKELGHDINSRLIAAQVVQGVDPLSPPTNASPPPSAEPDVENEMQISDLISDSEANLIAETTITDRIVAKASKHSTRPSSLPRLPLEQIIQPAGPSRSGSSLSIKYIIGEKSDNDSEFVISDDSEGTTTAPKRHCSQQSSDIPDTPFQEVKRKSRSKTNNSSSR